MFNDLSNCSFEDVALIVNTAGKTKEQPVFANSVRWIQHPRDERRIFVDPVNDIRPTTSFPELPSRSSRDYHVRTKCDVKYLERSKVHKELAQRALPLDKQLTFKRISSNFFSPRSKTLILRSTRNIDEKREIYERTLLPVHVSLFLSSSFFFFFSFFCYVKQGYTKRTPCLWQPKSFSRFQLSSLCSTSCDLTLSFRYAHCSNREIEHSPCPLRWRFRKRDNFNRDS